MPSIDCNVDENAKKMGLDKSDSFIKLIDEAEKLDSKNLLIISIREDGAIEAYCNLQHTEMVQNPNEFMILACVETCSRQAAASAGKKFPKSGTQEWAQTISRILMGLARRFMDKIED